MAETKPMDDHDLVLSRSEVKRLWDGTIRNGVTITSTLRLEIAPAPEDLELQGVRSASLLRNNDEPADEAHFTLSQLIGEGGAGCVGHRRTGRLQGIRSADGHA